MARLEALAKYVASLNSKEPSLADTTSRDHQHHQHQQLHQHHQHQQLHQQHQQLHQQHQQLHQHQQHQQHQQLHQQHQHQQSTVLSVRSSGFRSGNFSEIWFGSKLYLPRSMSRRGLTLLVLSQDLATFHLWQFDFYPFITARKVNENLIRLLQRVPAKSYITLSVKDDISRNLDFSARQFLSNTVGSKDILRLQFRDSWAIVVYKPTLASFRVLGEDHKSSGIARVDVQVPIHTEESSEEFIEKEDAVKKLSDEEENTEELNEGLHVVKKDLDDQLALLQELRTESEILKKQLTAQLEIIRSIKDLVIQNEEAVIALSEELNK